MKKLLVQIIYTLFQCNKYFFQYDIREYTYTILLYLETFKSDSVIF